MVNLEDVKELISYANTVCDCLKDSPCGCEGCWLWQSWYYEEKNGKPTEEELEEHECPMFVVIRELKKQIGE